MPLVPRLSHLLRNLFQKRRVEADLHAEVGAYVDTLTREKIAAGMRPDEARRAALVELGGAEQVKEQVRQARAGAWLDQFVQDVRFGVRMLIRGRGFTVVAALTLALGIGVSVAIFGVVDTVLFRPLPYADPDRLVSVYEGPATGTVLAWTEYTAFEQHARYLEKLAAIHPVTATVIGGDQPEQVDGALVSASLFPMLGIQPLVGRNFLPEEDRAEAGQAALLSEGLWRRRFGADRSILGRTITLEVNEAWGRPGPRAQSFTVVGVVPASFQALLNGIRGDVWLPLAVTPSDSHDLFVVARMKPGATIAQVKSDLEAITQPLRATMHSDGRAMQFTVVPLLEDLLGNWQRALVLLFGAVGFVLLIACVNVANLFLARGRVRQREMAIRAALGAGRRRLIRQLLTESVLLASAGGVLGVLVAYWGLRWLASLSPPDVPRLAAVQLDARVFAFMAAIVLLTAVLSGVAPALRLSRAAVYEGLKESARSVGEGTGGRRLRGLLVTAEVALAMVLLIASGLMLRTLAGLLRVDPGFDAQNVLSLRLSLPRHTYRTGAQRADFHERLFQQVTALPGVRAAGINHALPFGGVSTGAFVNRQGASESIDAQWRLVSPGYFDALRIPLLKGRHFTEADMRAEVPSAIVDELLAEKLWPGQDPVGQPIVMTGNPPFTVTGVVGSIRHSNLDQAINPTVYFAVYPRAGTLVVRSAGDPAALAPSLSRILVGLDKAVAPSDVQLMATRVSRSFALQQFTTLLLGIFAAAALFLGMVGLYGVISYSVSQRTHEIGVRMALGARRLDVARLVLGEGLKLVLFGVAAGLTAAFALTRLLSSLLFEVSATDGVTFAAVPLTLALVALLASYVPARRAAHVDPAVALRHE